MGHIEGSPHLGEGGDRREIHDQNQSDSIGHGSPDSSHSKPKARQRQVVTRSFDRDPLVPESVPPPAPHSAGANPAAGIEAWRQEYNEFRPHSSLGEKTPEQFLGSGDWV
ncbi:MAG TPA: hypothetical protein EYG08_16930, partial [Myxococcales bacterium]|nr:hypothetical protein [Myxococcales bacterium]